MSLAQLVSFVVVILFSLMLGYWAQQLSNLRVAELEFKPRQAASEAMLLVTTVSLTFRCLRNIS